MQLDKDLKSYGAKFQLSVLRLLIEDRKFGTKIRQVLSSDYFDNRYHKWFCDEILEFYNKYRTAPDEDYLRRMINEKIKTDSQKEVYETSLKK